MQCMLQRPGVGNAFSVYRQLNSPYRKQRSFVGTLLGLSSVSCKCSQDHSHIRIQGHARVEGKNVAVSRLAAVYPEALCEALRALAIGGLFARVPYRRWHQGPRDGQDKEKCWIRGTTWAGRRSIATARCIRSRRCGSGVSGYPRMVAALAAQGVGMVSGVLTCHLEELYNQGRPYSMGPGALAAVQRYHRRLRGQFRGAWAAARTWRCAEPGELRSPIPLLVLWALLALSVGYGDWGRAAMLSLMYHCSLRPGGAVELCRGDLRLPGDFDRQEPLEVAGQPAQAPAMVGRPHHGEPGRGVE
jgi:hypothetical protein